MVATPERRVRRLEAVRVVCGEVAGVVDIIRAFGAEFYIFTCETHQ